MRSLVLLTLALLVALLASGCAAVEGTPTTPAPTTQAVEPVNDRGFIPVEVGEQVCFGPDDAASCDGGVTFSIDKIVVDPPCVEYGERVGHTLVLSMRVATGTDTTSTDIARGIFNPYGFTVIGTDGVAQNAAFGICTDDASDPLTYGPNQKYTFELELEVPVAQGALALQPGFLGGSAGWEWPF
jgi:hypothetical protein